MVSQTARRNLEAHIQGERMRDLDALMRPLSPNPRFVIPPFIFEGREAVRAMYERALPLLTDEGLDEYQRALNDPQVSRWGDAHCVIEYSDQYRLHRGTMMVVHFDGDLVKSENTYFASASRYRAAPFDDLYPRVPGVSRID